MRQSNRLNKSGGNLISNILQKNLGALAVGNPDVVDCLEHLSPERHYRVERTASGWPVPSDPNRAAPFVFAENPLEEHRKRIRAQNPSGPCVPILLGCEDGCLPVAVCLEWGDRISAMLLIEPDIVLFHTVLTVLDLSKILGNPSFRVVLGEDPDGIEKVALSILPNIAATKAVFLQEQHLRDRYATYFSAARETLTSLLARGQAEARFLSEWGEQIQENIWRNARFTLTCPDLKQFDGILAGVPAVLVSGGPSLTKDLEQLSELHPLPLRIAVDTAYPVLQRAGLRPDIVATCDPTPLNRRHFDAAEPDPNCVLVFDPETYFEIPRTWPGPRVILSPGESPTCAWLNSIKGIEDAPRKPLSVAHAALEIALALGCDPIVLLGCDFAYNPQGGESHVHGAVLARRHDSIMENQHELDFISCNPIDPGVSEPLVWLPGKTGGQVPSSQVLALFVREFARRLRNCGRTIINAGSHGAQIDGTENHNLNEIKELFGSSIVRRERLADRFRIERRVVSFDITDLLKKQLNALDYGASLAAEAIRQIDKLPIPPDTGSLSQIESIFWKFHRDRAMKTVYGLSLYKATFSLTRGHFSSSPGDRLADLKAFFESVLVARECLGKAISESLCD